MSPLKEIETNQYILVILLCKVFSWHTLKYPTSGLIFQYTHEPFGECAYKEQLTQNDTTSSEYFRPLKEFWGYRIFG